MYERPSRFLETFGWVPTGPCKVAAPADLSRIAYFSRSYEVRRLLFVVTLEIVSKAMMTRKTKINFQTAARLLFFVWPNVY